MLGGRDRFGAPQTDVLYRQIVGRKKLVLPGARRLFPVHHGVCQNRPADVGRHRDRIDGDYWLQFLEELRDHRKVENGYGRNGSGLDAGYLRLVPSRAAAHAHAPRTQRRRWGGQPRDGSGEIYMMLNVRIVYSSDETLSNWVISEGLGAYTRLHGQGMIVATGEGNLVYDHYTGLLHDD